MGRLAALITVIMCSLSWPQVQAGSVSVPAIGGHLSIPVDSFQEKRFDQVIRQQYDFSCGSAAVASLLSHHYGHPVSEQEVFRSMFAVADEEKVRREGFSMLDMKRYLEMEGFLADGFRMPLADLREQVRLPVIVLLNVHGFRHFVVIKGISDREVLVGDPARGLKAYSRHQFDEYWDGTAFVIRSHLQQGRASFLGDGDWPDLARAPVERGFRELPGAHTLPYWPSSREW
ncbi:C39 family peptidase [Marinobacter sp. OP 3.4]|uniref:C39 family peptidase n=1 Tax=Marinobacter sp. OP 3.4 TaxID=3076501 RepID=UPI002E1B2B9A